MAERLMKGCETRRNADKSAPEAVRWIAINLKWGHRSDVIGR